MKTFMVLIGFLALFQIAPLYAAPSDRHLPFMAGEVWWISQDWNICSGTHCHEKAWDFNWGTASQDRGRPVLAPFGGSIEYASNTGRDYSRIPMLLTNMHRRDGCG